VSTTPMLLEEQGAALWPQWLAASRGVSQCDRAAPPTTSHEPVETPPTQTSLSPSTALLTQALPLIPQGEVPQQQLRVVLAAQRLDRHRQHRQRCQKQPHSAGQTRRSRCESAAAAPRHRLDS
jgi:hypothetical protein